MCLNFHFIYIHNNFKKIQAFTLWNSAKMLRADNTTSLCLRRHGLTLSERRHWLDSEYLLEAQLPQTHTGPVTRASRRPGASSFNTH